MSVLAQLTGKCPVCLGSKSVPSESGFSPCRNCGGQRMYGTPSGEVRLRPDGDPCRHDYSSRDVGRFLTSFDCRHCGDRYQIDSGD